MSQICRKGKLTRPSWDHRISAGCNNSMADLQLEMLESVRNAVEEVRRSQMLQCDVAHAIKDMAKAIKRIDKRLKQHFGPLTGVEK